MNKIVYVVKKVNVIQTIDTSDLDKRLGYYYIQKKFLIMINITTNDFNKFPGAIFDERSRQPKLETNSNLDTVE